MFRVRGLRKEYGERVILGGVDWHVDARDRVGLVGPNGAGKSTLLRILAGELPADAGDIDGPRDATFGHLPQEGIVLAGRTVLQETLAAFPELEELERRERAAEAALHALPAGDPAAARAAAELAHVHDERERHGAWTLPARAAQVLAGLGFDQPAHAQPVETLSGGLQMRVALAKLLLRQPTLLLLDEPTNHLDLPSRDWLEEFLDGYPGAVVLVSHDRYFLDRTVRRITEVELGKLVDYAGNYSTYKTEKQARYERLVAARDRQDRERARVQVFIDRFRAKNTKASQVQSRIKALEKEERIELPEDRSTVRIRFPSGPRSGERIVALQGAGKSYGPQTVLAGVDLEIVRGERVALVGRNGAGKSTLVRLLSGAEPPDSGELVLGHNVLVAWFAQDAGLELRASPLTVVEELETEAPIDVVPRLRHILGAFLFRGDDVDKPVRALSGGEKNRLALAKLLLRPSNFLLLDEPTNHLDLDSKEVLLEALREYSGTVLFVSHDRHFIDALATQVVDVGGGRAVAYRGNYEDFLYLKSRRGGEGADAVPAAPREGSAGRGPGVWQQMHARKEAEKARARARRDWKRKLEELEAGIMRAEGELGALEAEMLRPGFYDDGARAAEAGRRHQALKSELEALNARWEEWGAREPEE